MRELYFNIIVIVCCLTLGWLGHMLYYDWSNERIVNGLYFDSGNYSHDKVLEKARNEDNSNKWVCVNVKGMSYSDASNTCVHECEHYSFSEIWARTCELNNTKCGEIFDNLTK